MALLIKAIISFYSPNVAGQDCCQGHPLMCHRLWWCPVASAVLNGAGADSHTSQDTPDLRGLLKTIGHISHALQTHSDVVTHPLLLFTQPQCISAFFLPTACLTCTRSASASDAAAVAHPVTTEIAKIAAHNALLSNRTSSRFQEKRHSIHNKAANKAKSGLGSHSRVRIWWLPAIHPMAQQRRGYGISRVTGAESPASCKLGGTITMLLQIEGRISAVLGSIRGVGLQRRWRP